MPYKEKLCGIYCVTHIESGRMYIGKSSFIQKRWYEHVKCCSKYNNRFSNALKKYGKDAFSWKILEECDKNSLDDREKYWILKFDTINTGFNLTPGGDGIPMGYRHSPEERVAKSARQKGKPHSPEHNRKVSEALKGHSVAPHVLQVLINNAALMKGKKNPPSEQALINRRAAAAAKKGVWKQNPESHAKQWETRRAKYGSAGLSPAGLAKVAARAATLVQSRWGQK